MPATNVKSLGLKIGLMVFPFPKTGNPADKARRTRQRKTAANRDRRAVRDLRGSRKLVSLE